VGLLRAAGGQGGGGAGERGRGEAARANVLERFGWEKLAQQVEAVYLATPRTD